MVIYFRVLKHIRLNYPYSEVEILVLLLFKEKNEIKKVTVSSRFM